MNKKRRQFHRIPSNLKVRFSCCSTDYEGAVSDLSENGMLINTSKMNFPFESSLELFLAAHDKIIRMNAKVCRMTKSSDEYDGIGVEIINPPKQYIDFVRNLRSGQ